MNQSEKEKYMYSVLIVSECAVLLIKILWSNPSNKKSDSNKELATQARKKCIKGNKQKEYTCE